MKYITVTLTNDRVMKIFVSHIVGCAVGTIPETTDVETTGDVYHTKHTLSVIMNKIKQATEQ